MGDTLQYTDFTITKSNPSGNIVRFTLADPALLLTYAKMIRGVLQDAIQQWIDLERADLDSNGDTDVTGEPTSPGDKAKGDIGFAAFDWTYESKYAEVDLTALTNISVAGDITASAPYVDAA
ncbi:MAG: hypothetical protein V3T31_02135 [candidate division Zixibacteria bacterium]